MSDKVKGKGMVRVLVYGTLKDGQSNHVLLDRANAQFLGYDSITGEYNMYDLGAFPGVVTTTTGERPVRGEVWAVNNEGLQALDMLEGHPNFYERRKVVTDIMQVRAWVYILKAHGYMGSTCKPCVAGLWHPSKDEIGFWTARKELVA